MVGRDLGLAGRIDAKLRIWAEYLVLMNVLRSLTLTGTRGSQAREKLTSYHGKSSFFQFASPFQRLSVR